MPATKDLMREVQRIGDRAALRKVDSTRHRCFISYHVVDQAEVETFIDTYGSEFIAHAIGVTVDDDFVNSTDEEYIKTRIRERYLSNTTVTIVLLGACTWSRPFVDWEISSSLRNDPVNRRSGILALPLPSMQNSARLPDRVRDNWDRDDLARSYAEYRAYPSSAQQIRDSIEAAFQARTAKAAYVNNSRSLMRSERPCP